MQSIVVTGTLALICARGGSKGLPGKNIRLLAGKPLIGWAIETAKAVPRIDRVLVSTDSYEIADVAHKYGAEVPFMRPKELAKDDSPEWLVWRHALNWMKEKEGFLPSRFLCVPTTAPLRIPVDIENGLDRYEQGDCDMVISVTRAHRNPYFNMVQIKENNQVDLVIPRQATIVRRQEAPVVYDMTTVFYIARPQFILTHENMFEGRVSAIQVPLERAIDIDTLFDFKIAECLLQNS